MKKYIKPEIDICILDMENSLMAASVGIGAGENPSSSNPMDGSSALSKDHTFSSVWGSDDED